MADDCLSLLQVNPYSGRHFFLSVIDNTVLFLRVLIMISASTSFPIFITRVAAASFSMNAYRIYYILTLLVISQL